MEETRQSSVLMRSAAEPARGQVDLPVARVEVVEEVRVQRHSSPRVYLAKVIMEVRRVITGVNTQHRAVVVPAVPAKAF